MAEVAKLTAIVMSHIDPKVAGKYMNQYIRGMFPEVEIGEEMTVDSMKKELDAFVKKDVVLMRGKKGLTLKIEPKKG